MMEIDMDNIQIHKYLIDMDLYSKKDEEDRRFVRELIRKMLKYHEAAFSSSGAMPNLVSVARYQFILESLKVDGVLTNQRGKKLNDLLKENKEN